MLLKYNSKIIEQGNGLPKVGNHVYHHDQDELYRVLRYGCIQTDDLRGNYFYAEVELDGDTMLDERGYESLTPCIIELLDNDTQN